MHLEKLTNLGALPRASGFFSSTLSMKLRGGSASRGMVAEVTSACSTGTGDESSDSVRSDQLAPDAQQDPVRVVDSATLTHLDGALRAALDL